MDLVIIRLKCTCVQPVVTYLLHESFNDFKVRLSEHIFGTHYVKIIVALEYSGLILKKSILFSLLRNS